jgi:hypothetical protein
MVRNIKKFLKYNRGSKPEQKSHKSKFKVGSDIRCFECNQKGHIASDCPNRKNKTEKKNKPVFDKKKSKPVLVTWSDDSDNDATQSDSEKSEKGNVALAAFSQPSNDTDDDVSMPPVTDDGTFSNPSFTKEDLYELNENMAFENVHLKEKNTRLQDIVSLNEVQIQDLINSLSTLELKFQDLELENNSLKAESITLNQTIQRLKKEPKVNEAESSYKDALLKDLKLKDKILEPRPIALKKLKPVSPKRFYQHTKAPTHAYKYDKRYSKSSAQQSTSYQTNYAPRMHYDYGILSTPNYGFMKPKIDFNSNYFSEYNHYHSYQPYQPYYFFYGLPSNTYGFRSVHKPKTKKVWVQKSSKYGCGRLPPILTSKDPIF